MKYFADPDVGCVGARLVFVNRADSQVGSGGTSYWNYEANLKRWESRVNSLIGVSGCYYAIRKSLYSEIDTSLISDFVVALDTVQKGYRVAYAEEACCEEETLVRGADEFEMRVRVALRSYIALVNRKELMNPFRFGLFAFQLFSHKVLRYLVGLFLIGLFVTNLFLVESVFFQVTLFAQLLVYGLAFWTHTAQDRNNAKSIFAIPYYFVLVNYAALVALVRPLHP